VKVDKLFVIASGRLALRVLYPNQAIPSDMALRSFEDKRPTLGDGVFVDQSAQVIGDVRLRDGVSVWPGAVIRGDDDYVEVGRGSAVLDLCLVEGPKGRPARIGAGTIVSHAARLHGCEIGEECVVGVGAIVLDGAVIGPRSLIAAGSLVPPGAKLHAESFVVGLPGKVVRQTSAADIDKLKRDLKALSAKAKAYLADAGTGSR
jgi:carbonic anhydrase/acetyltransferase-like protein (isoleucine patch superfamily)